MSTTYGPYTPLRAVGAMVFISGQIGVDPATKTAVTTVSEQTAQALKNMEELLAGEGLTLKNVAKTTVFLASMDDFNQMNATYEKTFTAPRPARSTIAVRELPRVGGDTPLLVEIEAIASKELS